jgi:hypothetical protein
MWLSWDARHLVAIVCALRIELLLRRRFLAVLSWSAHRSGEVDGLVVADLPRSW